jgi:hypothetical protein
MIPPLSHLTDVGRRKALGLLSYPEIRVHGVEPAALKAAFNARAGYVTRDLTTGQNLWDETLTDTRQTLAAAHLPSLQKLLDRNRALLQRTGWPLDAAAFFDRSLNDYVLRGSPDADRLQDVIKTAYGYGKKPGLIKRCVCRVLRKNAF